MPPVEIRLIVNSRPHALSTEPCRTLLSLLREELGLLRVKEGCGQGDCGACVVVMDGQAVNSCLVLAAQADGAEIITLEGLAEEGRLHPLQRRFMEHWAFQCGFCTPGMILSCYALLLTHPQPTPDEVREAVAGNLCRCTSYHNIVAAVEAAAADLASPVILPDPGPVRDGVSAPAAGAWLPGEHSEAPLSARGEYSPPVILSGPAPSTAPLGQDSEESPSGRRADLSLESSHGEDRPVDPLRVTAGSGLDPSTAGGGAP